MSQPNSVWTKAEEQFTRAIDDQGVDVLSLDMFDTVMLRDHLTEWHRTTQAMKEVAASSGTANLLNPASMARLFALVVREGYAAVSHEVEPGDLRLRLVASTFCDLLDAPGVTADLVEASVIKQEQLHLQLNSAAVGLIRTAQAANIRVIVVSDTMYSTHDVARLVPESIAGALGTVYTSGDVQQTKFRGSIFSAVQRVEAVPPARIFHVGDTLVPDYVMPRRAGWQAAHVPRSATSIGLAMLGQIARGGQRDLV